MYGKVVEALLERNKNIVKRKIHDTFFLIDITQNYLENTCSLYEINDMGSFIWDQLDGSNGIQDITKMLSDMIEEEIEFEDIFNDIKEYIEILKMENFVVETYGRDQ